MKNTIQILILFVIFIAAQNQSFAQKVLNNCTVTYALKTTENNPINAIMGNAKMITSFKDSKVKTSMNIMGGMVSIDIIMDSNAKKGLMLFAMPMMGKNMAVELDEEGLNKNEENSNSKKSISSIEYKKDGKKIAGYKCKKALVRLDGFTEPVTIYVTDKINPAAKGQIQNQYPGLKGFPLGFEMVQAGIKVSFEAESVDKRAPSDAEFEMKVPEGFNIVGMEELKNLGGLGTFGL
jgi:hypothetical protein